MSEEAAPEPAVETVEARPLTGVQKAAALLLILGERHGQPLLARLRDDEIMEVSQAMTALGRIPTAVVEALLREFVEQLSASLDSLTGSYEATERLLSKALGAERAQALMAEVRAPAGHTMWDKLGTVSEAMLAGYLKNEHPQTIALVMSKIKPEHAARVLALLPEVLATEVMMRMLRMEPVQREVLEEVERVLQTEFIGNVARASRRDAHEVLAEIFNVFDRGTEARMMCAVEAQDPDAAERIRALMFTFDDLAALEAADVQKLLRQVERDHLATALKGAAEAVREIFFANMSERAARILREDMEALGPIRLREVEDAQMRIVALAKELAAQGDIVIATGPGREELVY